LVLIHFDIGFRRKRFTRAGVSRFDLSYFFFKRIIRNRSASGFIDRVVEHLDQNWATVVPPHHLA